MEEEQGVRGLHLHIGAGVVEYGAAVLDRLLEHGDDEPSVHHVLPGVHVPHSDVVIILGLIKVLLGATHLLPPLVSGLSDVYARGPRGDPGLG